MTNEQRKKIVDMLILCHPDTMSLTDGRFIYDFPDNVRVVTKVSNGSLIAYYKTVDYQEDVNRHQADIDVRLEQLARAKLKEYNQPIEDSDDLATIHEKLSKFLNCRKLRLNTHKGIKAKLMTLIDNFLTNKKTEKKSRKHQQLRMNDVNLTTEANI